MLWLRKGMCKHVERKSMFWWKHVYVMVGSMMNMFKLVDDKKNDVEYACMFLPKLCAWSCVDACMIFGEEMILEACLKTDLSNVES